MKAFTQLKGLACPIDRANIDTDAIIPKQFLKSIKRSGFGPYLFDEWRYLDHGEPGMDCINRPLNKNFVLNQPRYKGAQIMLARENFGCALAVSMRLGRLKTTASASLLRLAMQIFSLTIATKMECCR